MDVAVVSLPLVDFTTPSPSLASHKAVLAKAGIESVAIDYNFRACLDALSRERLAEWCNQLEARMTALVRRPNLGYWEQGELAALIAALPEGVKAQEFVSDALETFKTERFFSRDDYATAQRVWAAIQQVFSAASYPFEWSMASVHAPFLPWSEAAALRFAAVNPFRAQEEKLVQELKHHHVQSVVLVLDEPNQFPFAVSLSVKLREHLPDARLIVVGQLVSATAAKHSEVWLKRFDALIPIASETVLPGLVKGLMAAKPKSAPGAVVTDRIKVTIPKAAAPTVADVESLPLPDYSDISVADYPNPTPTLQYRPCRGRANQFATGQWKGLDEHGEMRKWLAPLLAAEQVSELFAQHQLSLIQLTCEPASLEWLLEFSDHLSTQASNVKFSAWVGLEGALLNPSAAERLRSAGCVSLVFSSYDNRESSAEPHAMFQQLSRSIEAAAHAGIAVQVAVAFGLPGVGENYARELVNLGRAHAQEIDVLSINEASRLPWRRQFLPETAANAFLYIGDELGAQPDGAASWLGAMRERTLSELGRISPSAAQPHPFAGSAGSVHTSLFFEKQGRRALQGGIRLQHTSHARPLSEGDRVKLSPSAKLLWIPYQLSVSKEIGFEELEVRDLELRRRARDMSADRVWTYSHREDLKLRAGNRTPHLLAPSMPPTELTMGLAELLALIQEQFLPVSQLVAKASREVRDALKRQLAQLHASGALLTEYQARREGGRDGGGHRDNRDGGSRDNGRDNGGRDNGGRSDGPREPRADGGQPGAPQGEPGQGRRRRRRRRGGGGGAPGGNGGNGGGQRFSGPALPQ